jgi:Amt family ammonium transporter
VGTVLIGLLSTDTGLLYGGGIRQLVVQILIAIAAMVFSAAITLIIALVLKGIMGWRITEEEELAGIDVTRHAETAWDLVGGFASRRSALAGTAPLGTAPVGTAPVGPAADGPAADGPAEQAPAGPVRAESGSSDPVVSAPAAQPATTGEPR